MATGDQHGEETRERLRSSRLCLVFTPSLCAAPEAVLEALLPEVDVVQVRVKDPEHPAAPGPARANHDWALAVLERAAHLERPPLVLVNDRVDVACVLAPHGLAGVHLGADDTPPAEARALLGPTALIGLSTHSQRDVARAADAPVDYLGFGPIFPTRTKGYARGLGPEQAWIARTASALPLLPIGGIDETNAHELARVGRAAVAAALLCADDPVRAARALRAALAEEGRASQGRSSIASP